MGDGHNDKHKDSRCFFAMRWIFDRASVADLGNDICTL